MTKSNSCRLRRVFISPELFTLLASGSATVAQVAMVAQVLQHPKDRVLREVAAARAQTTQERVSRLLAPLRGTSVLLTVRDQQRRGFGQQANLVQVLDAPELPALERVFFMAIQATGRPADTARGWAVRVFREGTDASRKVPNLLQRLTERGLLRQVTDWSWAVALGLEGTMPERVDTGDSPDDHAAPIEQESEVAAKLNPLLAQAVQTSDKSVVASAPAGLEAECVKAFRTHVAKGGALPPDMADEDLAQLLAGAAVDLQAAVRGRRDKLTPDVLQGVRDVIAWERQVTLEARDVSRDTHYLPLVRAGALQNFPQAMLTTVYAVAGHKNWRKYFHIRDFFTPGFDGAWDEIGIGTLMEVQAHHDSVRNKDDYRPPQLNSDQVFLPQDVHRLYCLRRGLEPQGMGLRAYAKGYEADVRSTQPQAAEKPAIEVQQVVAVAAPAAPASIPAESLTADPKVQQHLRSAQSFFRGAWSGAMAVAGPAKFLNVVAGLRHDGTGRQSILSPEHCLIQYLEDLRNRWAGLNATFGEFLTRHNLWSEVQSFDDVWVPMVAEADLEHAVDRLVIESLFQKRIEDLRFRDLTQIAIRGDKGFSSLTAWVGFVATASREEQAEHRAKRVAAWVSTLDGQEKETVCG